MTVRFSVAKAALTSLSAALIAVIFAACQGPTMNKSTSTSDAELSQAPVAKTQDSVLEIHGDTRVDPYFWMRLSDEQKKAETPDGQTQDVLDYLNAENAYTEGVMKHTEGFQKALFDEIVGRIVKDDQSVPVKDHGYWYYTRYEDGKEYSIRCRKLGSMDADEQIMVDQNELAEGHDYFAMSGGAVSPDNTMMVYGIDTVSRREYTLQVKNIETGEVFSDRIPQTTGGATWAADNRTLFYTKKDPQTLRSNQIFRHVLGTPTSDDVLVFEEKDETFSCFVGKSKTDEFLIIGSYSTLSSEWQVLRADDPNGDWRVIQPRTQDLEYGISHYGDHFYIVTNHEAKNFRLMRTGLDKTGLEHWEEVIPHRADVLLEGVDMFKNYLVVSERKEGLTQIRVKTWDGSRDDYMTFQDPAYMAYTGANPDFDTEILRYGYTSMTTPNSTYDFNMRTGDRELLKQQRVLDEGFAPENYASERKMLTARDGAQVPVSIVYRKGLEKNGQAPMLLYAYGSYGSSMDPYFSSVRLSLLDRGFVYVIAHIRGGQEMGRHWYEDGKLLKKMNTFTDFIDCGRALVDQGYTSPEHLYAMGGSAGGLLMGAVMNMAPDLWNGVVAAVPFVDVVSTMLDESIPLTTGEFDEWGNPKDAEYYTYMKAYSPYDNVAAMDYPHTLITTGYWDSQVQYWEPAKWIAKLRAERSGDARLVLKTNMEAGHGGASGRFRRFHETALEYAFILDLEGITE
ncbi:MAG: S9 family peptidase [Flavobacteriales bacterium]|nr:S9 family peptidase [Flavobacteriales bacterium]